MKLPIETPSLFGDYQYPFAKEIMEQQQDRVWTAQEIAVEKDENDYKVKMTPSQYNSVSVTLQLFVEIEQEVGKVWAEIETWFPHSEIEGACSFISAMEKSVHAFFYQKMTDVLQIEPETVEKNQQTIKELKAKLTFLKKVTSNLSQNKPLSLVTVAFIEQVFLFSNFAMLKAFQSNGHNLISSTVTGVDFVVFDELLHGELAKGLYKHYMEEAQEFGLIIDRDKLQEDVLTLAHEIVRHESDVIDYTFGTESHISGISKQDLKNFVMHRANMVLADFNISEIYHFTLGENPVAEWFYQGINSIKIHDFFVGGTNSYRRGWKLDEFSALDFVEGATT